MNKKELKTDLAWRMAQSIVQDGLLNGINLFDIKEKKQWDIAKNNIDKISKTLNKKLSYKDLMEFYQAGFKKI